METHLLDVESRPNVHDDPVRIGQLATDVQGGGQRNENAWLFTCSVSHESAVYQQNAPFLSSHPIQSAPTPLLPFSSSPDLGRMKGSEKEAPLGSSTTKGGI